MIRSLVGYTFYRNFTHPLIHLATECLDHVCRKSLKDATLLYACVLEGQSVGDKRQAIRALETVLDKYDYSTPARIHLPALLR